MEIKQLTVCMWRKSLFIRKGSGRMYYQAVKQENCVFLEYLAWNFLTDNKNWQCFLLLTGYQKTLKTESWSLTKTTICSSFTSEYLHTPLRPPFTPRVSVLLLTWLFIPVIILQYTIIASYWKLLWGNKMKCEHAEKNMLFKLWQSMFDKLYFHGKY